MIEIKLLDKNGIELKNGDVIRYVEIIPTFNNDFPISKDGISAKIMELKVNPQSEFDDGGMFYMPSCHYTKEDLLEAFDFPIDVNQDEYIECCLEYICPELNIEFTDEKSFFDFINGFEILEPKADTEG